MIFSRMIVRAVLGTSLIIAAAPTVAAETAAANSEPTKIAKADKQDEKGERLICKRFDSSASRMKSFKACHTAEQWKQIEKEKY